jgi:hypothetical protein
MGGFSLGTLADPALGGSSDTNQFDIEGNPLDLGGGGLGDTTLTGILGFDPNQQPTDPTNTGDTGVLQNTSTPALPSRNNPETAGNSSLGGLLNTGLNATFAAWQLASQPRGTPRTVTTKVGTTRVVSGAGAGGLTGVLGSTPQQQQSTLLLIIIAVVVIAYFRMRH